MHRSLPFFLLVSGWGAATGSTAAAETAATARGGKVEWARLVAGSQWNRHVTGDDQLLQFLRQNTSLGIDATWHAANPAQLESLSKYPFIFSTGLAGLSESERRNVGEYLRRGGFLLIDACSNKNINPDMSKFVQDHVTTLRAEFPDLRVTVLPADHEVFTLYFRIRERPPQARQGPAEPVRPLHACYAGDRLVAMISISSLQCGWSGIGRMATPTEFREMIANIYVSAMTR
jgi:hypothetical protein